MKIKNGLTLNALGDSFVVTAESPEVFRGMIKLNKSGTFIFELLQKEISVKEAVEKITEKYDVDEQTAENDFLELIRLFESSSLLEK